MQYDGMKTHSFSDILAYTSPIFQPNGVQSLSQAEPRRPFGLTEGLKFKLLTLFVNARIQIRKHTFQNFNYSTIFVTLF
jgi:hypothetical protein